LRSPPADVAGLVVVFVFVVVLVVDMDVRPSIISLTDIQKYQ
jgi:hypothetical protein